MKLLTKTASILSACALIVGLSACSGGGGRPSEAQVAEAIMKPDSVFGSTLANNAPEGFADCFAELLVKSKLSDATLRAIVDGDTKYQGSQADEDALRDLSGEVTDKCVLGK